MKNSCLLIFTTLVLISCGTSSEQSKAISQANVDSVVTHIKEAVPALPTETTMTTNDDEAPSTATQDRVPTSNNENTTKVKSTTTTQEKEVPAQQNDSPENNIQAPQKQPTSPETGDQTSQKSSNTASPTANAPKTTTPKVPKPQAPTKPNHNTWNSLLQKHVSNSGKVNYSGFKTDLATLNAYLADLAANAPNNTWSRNEKMAYWINAYNAFTVKLIVQNYPTSSITKLHGGKPWDHKWIQLGNKTYTLNNIENDILRPVYKDARIHFAVNCAAKSCPPLLNQAWTASNLNNNFEKQAKAFINNPKFNKISTDTVEISKIFEWYAVDFDDLLAYLNKYSTTQIDANAKISYKEYDWALNE